jgi:hypothetical protein
MSKNLNSNSQKVSKVTTLFFCFFAVLAVLITAFPKLYEIKTKAGIDLAPGIHAGTIFEKYSHGLFKCEWLYPYRCDRKASGKSIHRHS